MGHWSLSTIETDVSEVANAAKGAYDDYKERADVEHEGHVHAAIEAAIDGAQKLVDSGIFGQGKVQVTVSGTANPDATSVPGMTAPDQVTLHVVALQPVPEVPPYVPGEPPVPPMSQPHQDQVPPPGPGGAAQTAVGDYNPNPPAKGRSRRQAATEATDDEGA